LIPKQDGEQSVTTFGQQFGVSSGTEGNQIFQHLSLLLSQALNTDQNIHTFRDSIISQQSKTIKKNKKPIETKVQKPHPYQALFSGLKPHLTDKSDFNSQFQEQIKATLQEMEEE